jgi:hypothetical protein
MKRFKNEPEDGVAGWGAGAGLDVGSIPERPPEPPKKSFFRRLFG